MRVELVTPCPECDDVRRSAVFGFSPEAVLAAANAYHDEWMQWASERPRPVTPEYLESGTVRVFAAALAAAWATDFGGS